MFKYLNGIGFHFFLVSTDQKILFTQIPNDIEDRNTQFLNYCLILR